MRHDTIASLPDIDKAIECARSTLEHLLTFAARSATPNPIISRQIWAYEVELQRLGHLREGLLLGGRGTPATRAATVSRG
jgi:hypothetical protein